MKNIGTSSVGIRTATASRRAKTKPRVNPLPRAARLDVPCSCEIVFRQKKTRVDAENREGRRQQRTDVDAPHRGKKDTENERVPERIWAISNLRKKIIAVLRIRRTSHRKSNSSEIRQNYDWNAGRVWWTVRAIAYEAL
jgi:hypothetical protein